MLHIQLLRRIQEQEILLRRYVPGGNISSGRARIASTTPATEPGSQGAEMETASIMPSREPGGQDAKGDTASITLAGELGSQDAEEKTAST